MPASQTSPIRIGQQLGDYRVERVLGSGGMGIVYLAQDCVRDRTVAIKVVTPSRDDDGAPRLLLREARLTAALDHPSICRVHEVGRIGDEPFIVMEHIQGEPLAALIRRRRALPCRTAIDLEQQLADAVAHAHEHQIVHGDLKSANIMIEPAGRAKILDFGLASQRASGGMDGACLETTVAVPVSSCTGTVPYMAPELLRGRAADPRSDLWALGVVFFEMVAGYRPFRGSTVYELAAAILGQDAQPLPDSVPIAVRQIIDRCLCPSPLDRFGSARELAGALEGLP